MFKSWQVFIFSLVPLALVFTGVVIGSMPGSDGRLEPTPTPGPPPTAQEPRPTPEAGVTVIELHSDNERFDQTALTAPAGDPVQLILTNDEALIHNFSLYTNQSASQAIFVGEYITGPGAEILNEFTAPPPGAYFFRCDAHPDTMQGQFTTN